MKSPLILIIGLLFLTSCFKTAQQIDQESKLLEDDKVQKANLQADLDSAKIGMNKLAGEQSLIKQQLEEIKTENEELKSRLSSLESQLSKFESEVKQHLNTIIEDMDNLSNSMSSNPTSGKKNNDQPKASPESKEKIQTHDNSKSPRKNKTDLAIKPDPKSIVDPKNSDSTKHILDSIKTSFEAKDYNKVIDLCDEVLHYKKLKRKDEIYFYQGGAHMNLKNYKLAIVSYNEIVEKFPKSKYRNDAILQSVKAFERLGMKEEAQTYRKILK